ncbi:MAG: hypothetical protein QNJ74_26855 [Trichodesmium sp. MO_231.B1]|nr:hypothetical protein [Trichodesmium sp. MO_231.B1]
MLRKRELPLQVFVYGNSPNSLETSDRSFCQTKILSHIPHDKM